MATLPRFTADQCFFLFVIPPFFFDNSIFFVILDFSYTFESSYNEKRYNKIEMICRIIILGGYLATLSR